MPIHSLGAINKQTNTYTRPSEAKKGIEYICPECKRALTFRNGKINRPHFAHIHVSETQTCNYYDRPTESQIHKDAKQLLEKLLINKTDIIFEYTCSKCDNIDEIGIEPISENSHICQEYRFKHNNSNKIADVAYLEKDEIYCLFEIMYKHKTRDCDRPEPWFEIDATKLIEIANENNFDYNKQLRITCLRETRVCDECVQKENQRKKILELSIQNTKDILFELSNLIDPTNLDSTQFIINYLKQHKHKLTYNFVKFLNDVENMIQIQSVIDCKKCIELGFGGAISSYIVNDIIIPFRYINVNSFDVWLIINHDYYGFKKNTLLSWSFNLNENLIDDVNIYWIFVSSSVNGTYIKYNVDQLIEICKCCLFWCDDCILYGIKSCNWRCKSCHDEFNKFMQHQKITEEKTRREQSIKRILEHKEKAKLEHKEKQERELEEQNQQKEIINMQKEDLLMIQKQLINQMYIESQTKNEDIKNKRCDGCKINYCKCAKPDFSKYGYCYTCVKQKCKCRIPHNKFPRNITMFL